LGTVHNFCVSNLDLGYENGTRKLFLHEFIRYLEYFIKMTPEAIKVTHAISTSPSCGELARLGQMVGDHSCLGFNHVIFNGLQEQKGRQVRE
jgi:hypothetical protein